jgi:WD40 repeat protein/uncharacterized caspase-like protein
MRESGPLLRKCEARQMISMALFMFSAISCLGQTRQSQGELAEPQLVLQASHTGTVTGVAFSADGRLLISGGFDGIIKVWDPLDRRELRSIHLDEKLPEGTSTPDLAIHALAFTPNGKAIAAAVGRRLILWAPSKTFIESLSGEVMDLAMDAAGRWIAIAATDNTVRICKAEDLHPIRTLTGHQGPVLAVAASTDGTRLVSGGVDKDVMVWDVTSGRRLHILHGHSDWVRSLAFSPDGRTIASGSDDSTVRIWNAESGAILNTFKMDSQVDGLTFSHDGRYLAAGSDQGEIELFDFNCGTPACVVGGTPVLATTRMTGVLGTSVHVDLSQPKLRMMYWSAGRLSFSPDGKFLTRGGQSTLHTWRVPTLKSSGTLGRSADVQSARFSPDGRSLAVKGSYDVELWNMALGRPQRTLTVPSAGGVMSIDFGPSGNRLAAGYVSGLTQIWDLATGQRLVSMPAAPESCPSKCSGIIEALKFSSDGKILATASANNTIKIWDALTGSELRTLPTELSPKFNSIPSLAFRPDGNWIATSFTPENTVSVWDTLSGKKIKKLDGDGGVFALAVDNRSSSLAAAGNFGIRLWKSSDWRRAEDLPGYKAWAFALSFSADGRLLATGSADDTIRIWNVANSKIIRTLTGYAGSPSFSADSKWIASSGDGEVVVRDTQTGEMKAALVSFGRNDWLVTTPQGLFDGSPGAWTSLIWRFSNEDIFDVLPVEAFFSEFYRPGLLSDIFAGTSIAPPEKIADIDRRQPKLKISSPDVVRPGSVSIRTVRINIHVDEVKAEGKYSHPSGARDLRLFRNGSLVKVWHGEVEGADLQTEVPIIAGDNVFTAYGFNDADVKSRDAQLRIVGASSLKRKGTAYILAVGVNKYANPGYDLRYAAQDALDFANELRKQETDLNTFSQVEVVPLIDDQATKGNLLTALHALAGDLPAASRGPVPAWLGSLGAAQPEDVVFVYFAGHGTSAGARFYLIPHDLGYDGNREQLNQEKLDSILEHSISDEELRQAFERIDAGRLVLIIDACNSGQALEAAEKRRGPMNSNGLAQLAYEKGMYILTASQSYQAALEAEQLGHGLLTYALVEEGLKTPAAEGESVNGELSVRDWLDFAARRVPEIQHAQSRQSNRPEDRGGKANPDAGALAVQQPRVFYRREADAEPLIIARIPSKP